MTKYLLAAFVFFCVLLASCSTTNVKQAVYTEPQYTQEELICLAQNIYFEARGESRDGQFAVGLVTINRTMSEQFPSEICSVVYQGGIDGSKARRNRCQFSWYCDGLPDVPRDMNAWGEAKNIARMILSDSVEDITNGATYFHAHYVNPRWARSFVRTTVIDDHIFYKPREREFDV